jgi:hypothetical protein
MFHWLESHAYLAAWLALPVAIATAFIQNAKTQFKEVDWSRTLLYLAFLTALPVAFTPTFDESARETARYLVSAGVAFLIIDRKLR